MINNLLQDDTYKNLTSSQVKQLIEYLQANNQEFNLTATLNCIEFSPQLPSNIYNTLNQFTLFSLMNYTFSSLVIKNSSLEFEAGFGSENFGSVCSIPYTAVFQIGIDDSILYINPVATIEENCKGDDYNQKLKSMNAFKVKK
jgi:hypothetical protein